MKLQDFMREIREASDATLEEEVGIFGNNEPLYLGVSRKVFTRALLDSGNWYVPDEEQSDWTVSKWVRHPGDQYKELDRRLGESRCIDLVHEPTNSYVKIAEDFGTGYHTVDEMGIRTMRKVGVAEGHITERHVEEAEEHRIKQGNYEVLVSFHWNKVPRDEGRVEEARRGTADAMLDVCRLILEQDFPACFPKVTSNYRDWDTGYIDFSRVVYHPGGADD